MRKLVLASVAAFGLLAVGMTAMGPAATLRADAEGSGADVRVTRHTMVAMAAGTVAENGGRAHSLLVANTEGAARGRPALTET